MSSSDRRNSWAGCPRECGVYTRFVAEHLVDAYEKLVGGAAWKHGICPYTLALPPDLGTNMKVGAAAPRESGACHCARRLRLRELCSEGGRPGVGERSEEDEE